MDAKDQWDSVIQMNLCTKNWLHQMDTRNKKLNWPKHKHKPENIQRVNRPKRNQLKDSRQTTRNKIKTKAFHRIVY